MKNILHISLFEDLRGIKYDLMVDEIELYTILILNVSPYEKYENVISNYSLMQKDFKDTYEMQKSISDLEALKIYEKYTIKNIELYKELFLENSEIYITGEKEDIYTFLKNNNCLLKKKIILKNLLSLKNYEDIELTLKFFGDFKNLYVLLDGNDEMISVEELKLTYNYINEICNKVIKYNLSPLEKLVYVYDLTRNREYKKENEYECGLTSRDLTKVLLGDKIVCVGFAKIFDAVLKKIGFSSELDILIRENEKNIKGHMRNAVYLKDDKYEINGIYYFDPTFGCKKINDKKYFNNYKYFARSKQQMEYMFGDIYKDVLFEGLDYDFVENVENAIRKKGILSLDIDSIRKVNNLSKFIDGYSLINREYIFKLQHNIGNVSEKDLDIEYIINRLYEYIELFNNSISNRVLIEAIFNVRKIEYYENPELYSLELEDFYEIFKKSRYGFCSTGVGKLLASIYGFNNPEDFDNMEDYVMESDLDKKIEQVKLAKALRLGYEKRR